MTGDAGRPGTPGAGPASKRPRRHRLTLRQYVRRRNGVPLGAPGSLRGMLRRAFGARSFAGFWQHWNPIFGYWLGRHVFEPLKRVCPPALALVLTFAVTGIIHDLVTMAVRRDLAFLFTPWFLFLGLGVALGQAARMDLATWPWVARAALHAGYVSACLVLAVAVFRVS